MRQYNAISADSHLEGPPEKWASRLPKSVRQFAPRTVQLPEGGDGWQIGDSQPVALGLQVTGGQAYGEFKNRGRSFSENLPGTGGAEQRLQEQDRDGVDAEVLFSSVVATILRQVTDAESAVAITQSYNNWLSEYCSVAPDRLFGIALMPVSSAEDAAREAERVATLPGIRGVHLLQFPSGSAWATYSDEPFWSTVNDLGICVVAHHNFGGEGKKSVPATGTKDKPLQIEGTVDLASFAWLLTSDLPMPTLPILTIEQIFLGGVLDRYPKLRFHFAETGIGWLAYWLEQMDDRYDRHRFWAGVELQRRPSEYVRQHFTFSFQEDHVGVATRHLIGIDNICWASDFPHAVSDWPWSRETRERQFAGVPDVDRRKMEALNIAAQLGVISAAEKEQLAKEPRTSSDLQAPPRGSRRLGQEVLAR
jgi:uncharacterized protein